MAVRLRLRREGTKKQPHYRVVAADRRAPRNGKFIEIIGEYHPMDDPSRVEIDHERALHWLRNGAQPSSQVEKLLRIVGVWEEFKPGDEPARERTKQAHAEAKAKLEKQGRTLAGRDVAEVEAEKKAEEEAAAAEEEAAAESDADEQASTDTGGGDETPDTTETDAADAADTDEDTEDES